MVAHCIWSTKGGSHRRDMLGIWRLIAALLPVHCGTPQGMQRASPAFLCQAPGEQGAGTPAV